MIRFRQTMEDNMKPILILSLIALLTAASVSPSLAAAHKARGHGYSQSYGTVPSYANPPSRQCAPHYDSAGVADGCL
jgi:hypothetical protein